MLLCGRGTGILNMFHPPSSPYESLLFYRGVFRTGELVAACCDLTLEESVLKIMQRHF